MIMAVMRVGCASGGWSKGLSDEATDSDDCVGEVEVGWSR